MGDVGREAEKKHTTLSSGTAILTTKFEMASSNIQVGRIPRVSVRKVKV